MNREIIIRIIIRRKRTIMKIIIVIIIISLLSLLRQDHKKRVSISQLFQLQQDYDKIVTFLF